MAMGSSLQWLAARSITPYMRTRDSVHRKNCPVYPPERFTYELEDNRYICPAGQPLNYLFERPASTPSSILTLWMPTKVKFPSPSDRFINRNWLVDLHNNVGGH
jgi:hypothetical protein